MPMTEPTPIFEGLQLMLIGMSTVFVFLSILVLVVNLMKHFLAEAESVALDKTDNSSLNTDEIAAISAAVHQYRQQTQTHIKGSK